MLKVGRLRVIEKSVLMCVHLSIFCFMVLLAGCSPKLSSPDEIEKFETAGPISDGNIVVGLGGVRQIGPYRVIPGDILEFQMPDVMRVVSSEFTEWLKPTFEVILDDPISTKDSRRHYVRVEIYRKNEIYHAKLTGDQGSGILNSMVVANGLAIIPENWTAVKAGSHVKAMWLD